MSFKKNFRHNNHSICKFWLKFVAWKFTKTVLYKRNLQASINLNIFIILEISQKLKYNEQKESYYHTIQANRNVPDSSTRGVHTERSKRHVLWETKLPFIVYVFWFHYSLHDFLSCSLEVKNHLVSYFFECNLFSIFYFHFFLFSSDRESKYSKVGILFINTTDFFFPNWM